MAPPKKGRRKPKGRAKHVSVVGLLAGFLAVEIPHLVSEQGGAIRASREAVMQHDHTHQDSPAFAGMKPRHEIAAITSSVTSAIPSSPISSDLAQYGIVFRT